MTCMQNSDLIIDFKMFEVVKHFITQNPSYAPGPYQIPMEIKSWIRPDNGQTSTN